MLTPGITRCCQLDSKVKITSSSTKKNMLKMLLLIFFIIIVSEIIKSSYCIAINQNLTISMLVENF